MNGQLVRDRLARATSRYVVPPLFRDSTDGSSVADHIAATETVRSSQAGGARQVDVATLAGELTGFIHQVQARADARATIVWHAGFAEQRSESVITRLLQLDRTLQANVIAVVPPLHASTREVYAATRELDRFVAMTATGTHLVDLAVREATGPVIVAGYSLGGFVALTHLAYVGSATAYVPMAVGQRLGTVLADHHIGSRLDDRSRQRVRDRLNLPVDLSGHLGTRLFPILAEFDQMSPAAIQGPSYGGPVTTWPIAHLTRPERVAVHARPFVDRLLDQLT